MKAIFLIGLVLLLTGCNDEGGGGGGEQAANAQQQAEEQQQQQQLLAKLRQNALERELLELKGLFAKPAPTVERMPLADEPKPEPKPAKPQKLMPWEDLWMLTTEGGHSGDPSL